MAWFRITRRKKLLWDLAWRVLPGGRTERALTSPLRVSPRGPVRLPATRRHACFLKNIYCRIPNHAAPCFEYRERGPSWFVEQ